MNVTDPSEPTQVGRLATTGTAVAVRVEGRLAYVACGSAGVQIFEVGDPSAPVRLGSAASAGSAVAVRRLGQHLFVADQAGGLVVWDVTEPGNPRRVVAVDTGGRVVDLQLTGTTLYVADAVGGLRIFDVRDATAPALLGRFDVTGVDGDTLPKEGYALQVRVEGTRAYLVDWPVGVRILDVSNPANPVELGRIASPNRINGLAVAGARLWLATGASGVELWVVTDPASPVKGQTFDTSGVATAVDVVGNTVFVADRLGGLQMVEFGPAGPPRFLGGLGSAGFARRVQVVGSHAYVANGMAGLKVFDVSEPARPRVLAELDTPGNTVDLHVVDQRAYLADGTGGLRIIDVAQPAHPVALADYQTDAPIRTVQVVGNRAWLAADVAGVEVLELTDLTQLKRVGRFQTVGRAGSVKYSEGQAFVADDGAGLVILDARDVSRLVAVRSNLGGNSFRPSEVQVYRQRVDAFQLGAQGDHQVFDLRGLSIPGYRSAMESLDGPTDAQWSGESLFMPANTYLRVLEYEGRSITAFPVLDQGTVSGVGLQGTNAFLAVGELGLRVVGFEHRVARSYQTLQVPTTISFAGGLISLDAKASSGLPVVVEVLSGPATVENNQLRLTGLGALRLRVSQAGSDLFQPTFAEVTLKVLPNQSLTLHSPTNSALAPHVAHPIQAEASSGLPLSFRVLTGPAEIRDGSLWITNVGRVTWVAEQVGNADFIPVAVTNVINRAEHNLQRLGGLPVGGRARAVKVRGRYAYLGVDTVGLVVVDVSDPLKPALVGNSPAGVQAAGLEVVGNLAYLVSDNGLFTVIDVTEPSRPSRVGEVKLPGVSQAVQVTGNYAYVPAGYDGLYVVDVSDPRKPSLAGQFQTGGYAEAVKVVRSKAYLANGLGGVVILDLGNPSKPVELGRLSGGASDYFWDVEVAGDLLLATTLNSGAHIIDVADARHPRLVSNFVTGAYRAVRVVNGVAYLMSDSSLVAFDVTDPTTPVLSGLPLSLPNSPFSLEVAGDHAYIASLDVGLQVAFVGQKIIQTLAHSVPAALAFTRETVPLAGAASSGLPVRWKVVRGPATVVGDSLQLTDVGAVALTMDQSGADWVGPVSLNLTVQVVPAPQTLSLAELPAVFSPLRPVRIVATSSSGLPVSVDRGSGAYELVGDQLTPKEEGRISIQLRQPGNSRYQPAFSSLEIQVRLAPEVGWELTSQSLRFRPGTNAAGPLLQFTSHDGTGAPPLREMTGGVSRFSGEFKPPTDEQDVWIADYVLGDEFGSIGFKDAGLKRQLDAAGEVELTAPASYRPDAPAGQAEIGGTLRLRWNGEDETGTYTFAFPDRTFTGEWSPLRGGGAASFDRLARRLNLELTLPDPTGASRTWRAETGYAVGDDGALEWPAFDAAQSIGGVAAEPVRFEPTRLRWNRAARRFEGAVSLVDGDTATAWPDYRQFQVSVLAPIDEDADGWPDVTDAEFSPRVDLRGYSPQQSSSFNVFGRTGEILVLEQSSDLREWTEERWLKGQGATSPIYHYPSSGANWARLFWRLRSP